MCCLKECSAFTILDATELSDYSAKVLKNLRGSVTESEDYEIIEQVVTRKLPTNNYDRLELTIGVVKFFKTTFLISTAEKRNKMINFSREFVDEYEYKEAINRLFSEFTNDPKYKRVFFFKNLFMILIIITLILISYFQFV